MTDWQRFCLRLIHQECEMSQSRTFRLNEFIKTHLNDIRNFRPNAKTPEATIRRVLQELRDYNLIKFRDMRGTYTLIQKDPLNYEVADEDRAFVMAAPDDKIEYVREVFARDSGLVNQAKEAFGCACMCANCSNVFIKADGQPYIEVHHLQPLSEGGEDALRNLCVICAHHHRQVHFGRYDDRMRMTDELTKVVECRL
ncbi:MAG: HNH endonuclease [Planctomycetes bacterium]|nr:HNH endonuclease [Planctomycetota bacterium]